MTSRLSLRSRWTRAFFAVFLALFIGGTASVTGTVLLVNSFAASGDQLEEASTYLAQIRADIVPYAVAAATPGEAGLRTTLGLALRTAFARGDAVLTSRGERDALHRAETEWLALDDALHTVDATSPAAQLRTAAGAVVAADVPGLLAALDATGASSRAAARAGVHRSEDLEVATVSGWIAAFLLAIVLLIRLARRLSTGVLEPVSHLRSSANLLAAGDLHHRVPVEREDELGDLARSFNAMADAIAGTQTSLARQAHHDSLTGLMNRGGFHSRVEEMLAVENRRPGLQALLFIDLDDFKEVNDERGHAAGDALLCVVASRLLDVVRPGDAIARLGGDEFAILLDGIPNGDVATQLAARTVSSLALPVDIGGDLVRISASVGIAVRVEESNVDVLMREADVAMYSAKSSGKNRFVCYDASWEPVRPDAIDPMLATPVPVLLGRTVA